MDHALYRKTILRGFALMALFACFVSLAGCGKSTEPEDVLEEVTKYQEKVMAEPKFGSQNGDWTVIARSRSDSPLSEAAVEVYRADVVKNLKDTDGVLSTNKYTEYSRTILALTAIGQDPRDMDGYNLLEPLADLDSVVKQGLNGAIYALLALDCGDYEIPSSDCANPTTRDKLISNILERELDTGGFALDVSSTQAEPDITAMALQALAPYEDREEIKTVITRGLEALSSMQAEDGSFASAEGDVYGSEAVSQTIIALSILGIDCQSDAQFTKGENSLYDAFLEYRTDDGSFLHLKGEENTNGMATEQAMCALTAYLRYKNGESGFYTMTE